jgi:hypothetical protein
MGIKITGKFGSTEYHFHYDSGFRTESVTVISNNVDNARALAEKTLAKKFDEDEVIIRSRLQQTAY